MKRPEIHVIDLQGHVRAIVFRLPYADYRALAMNAFLSEAMVRRQFDFNGYNVAYRRQRQGGIRAPPGDRDTAPADILRMHRAMRPERRRRDVAPELNIHARAFTPVNIFHFFGEANTANLAPAYALDQYRKWVIPRCLPRLSGTTHDF